tara:strand:- start:742 stop:939 length:198 start_codon:yes stop_codon:yes gene_type:complete
MDEIKKENNLIKFDKEKTQFKKERFIKEIRGGLGKHIKQNGNNIIRVKTSFFKRIIQKVRSIFKK